MTRRPRKDHWPEKAKQLGVALAPLLIATAVVAISLAIRVTTAVELELAARAVAFTVGDVPTGEEKPYPFLDTATVFSALAIEDCGSVSFPQMHIGVAGDAPMLSAGAVTFRCDFNVPGSKVVIRSQPGQELGIVERVLARDKDTIGLELTSVTPPGIRLQMAGDVTFDFSLRQQVPFSIITEFADVEGVAVPTRAAGLARYDAYLSDSSSSRQAQAKAGSILSVVIELAAAEGMATLFRKKVDIPLASISLFQRSDVDDAFVSTVLDGELRYTTSRADSVHIDDGDSVRFRGVEGLRLIGLGADPEKAGLVLTLEGDAVELSTNGTDRRLRLFDSVVSDRNRGLVAMIAVIASQLVWLRQQWWPVRKA